MSNIPTWDKLNSCREDLRLQHWCQWFCFAVFLYWTCSVKNNKVRRQNIDYITNKSPTSPMIRLNKQDSYFGHNINSLWLVVLHFSLSCVPTDVAVNVVLNWSISLKSNLFCLWWQLVCRLERQTILPPPPPPPRECLDIVSTHTHAHTHAARTHKHFACTRSVFRNSVSTHIVWLQKCQRYRKYRTDKHSVRFWSITATLTMTTAIQSFQMLLRHHQTMFGGKRISSSEDIADTIIFWMHEPSPWLIADRSWSSLTIAKQSFAGNSGSWWCITIVS